MGNEKQGRQKNVEHKQNIEVSCLKQGSEMNRFCLKTGSRFEGLGGTPPPKLPLSVPPGPSTPTSKCVEEHAANLIGDFVGDLLEDHSPVCILGVGSGSGSNDLSFIEILSRLCREGDDKCQFFQRTIEPDKNVLQSFRSKAEDLPEEES